MKRKAFLSLAALVLAFTSFAGGCGAGEAAVALDYGTGETATGTVYSELYYKNDHTTFGADPGILWVSEEEDETYGGWFYVYTSAQMNDPGGEYGEKAVLANTCMRSKDMLSWEVAGACDGYALYSPYSDWTLMNFWAPEVIHWTEEQGGDGMYYMYYSAQRGTGDRRSDAWTSNYDDLYLAIAKSESPMGPFRLVTEGTNAYGETITNTPILDFEGHYQLDHPFAAIDTSMLYDEASGKWILTFAKHQDSNSTNIPRGIWGMEMLDPVTPDFGTLTCFTLQGAKAVTGSDGQPYKQPKDNGYVKGQPYEVDEPKAVYGDNFKETANINEGNFLFEHDGKYYLTYSCDGFSSKGYSIMQAVADNPLGPYVKPDNGKGNPVVSTTASNISYLAGTGHHSMLAVGDELFTVYAHHTNPSTFSDAHQRTIGIDRLNFVEIDGQTVLTSNGPTASPQPLPEAISGYENVAKNATVSVSTGTNKQYINDGLLSVSSTLKEFEFRADGKVTVTLEFAQPTEIRSVMVYNSSNYNYAFTKVDEIRLYFAENATYNGKSYVYGSIQDLAFPEKYVDTTNRYVYQGAAAIADFKPITVKKITITVSEKFVTTNFDGSALNTVGIADIVVL